MCVSNGAVHKSKAYWSWTADACSEYSEYVVAYAYTPVADSIDIIPVYNLFYYHAHNTLYSDNTTRRTTRWRVNILLRAA